MGRTKAGQYFCICCKVVLFDFWHEAVNDGHELMPVDYIHSRLPCSETTLLENLPTFFYFGITELPLKKKNCTNFTSNEK